MALSRRVMTAGTSALSVRRISSRAGRTRPPGRAINRASTAWIRGHFDAVIDFDRVVRDPADPSRLRADLQVGDWLHLNPAGYGALAAGAVPTRLFGQR